MTTQCQCGHREESHLPQHLGGCNLCRCPQFTPIPSTEEAPSDPAGHAAGSRSSELKRYDAGLLYDFGGGNVAWWFQYIRDLLSDAHAHYRAFAQDDVDCLTAELAQAQADSKQWLTDSVVLTAAFNEKVDQLTSALAQVMDQRNASIQEANDLRHEASLAKRLSHMAEARGLIIGRRERKIAWLKRSRVAMQKHYAEKYQECEKAKSELAQAREALESHCKDWADDDTAIKKLAEPFGIDIDGRGYFVNVVDVVEQMAKKLAESELARERMRSALEKCVSDIHFWSEILDKEWSGFDGQLYGALNCATAALSDQPSGTLEKVRSAISSARFNLVGDNNSLPVEVVSLLHNQRNAVIHIDEAIALIGEPKP